MNIRKIELNYNTIQGLVLVLCLYFPLNHLSENSNNKSIKNNSCYHQKLFCPSSFHFHPLFDIAVTLSVANT